MKSGTRNSLLAPPGTDDLVTGDHGDPFSILGTHKADEPGQCVIRAFLPEAKAITVLRSNSDTPAFTLERVRDAGFFAAIVPEEIVRRGYRLRVTYSDGTLVIEDPYRFPLLLGDVDIHLFAEGTHRRAYEVLGAHPVSHGQIEGTRFAVWAPNARRVSVVGDFNFWDGRRHPMRFRPECGIWEIFLPGVGGGAFYSYEIKTGKGEVQVKADPFAQAAELPPGTASRIVGRSSYQWGDRQWMEHRGEVNRRDRPISVYEVHLGSWRRHEDGRWLSYLELAEQLVDYVQDMGFSHVELMPVAEFPFDGSWGYQPIELFAPTSRFGGPDDFRALVDAFHQAGIGVLIDWVPGHFPEDGHGLARFDGTCLYEHEDERRGRHKGWDTLIYNYGRTEVAGFLIANALYWLREFHVDGLRIDAVASMLYLDYDRGPGEWAPNVHGDNRNLEAVEFLRHLNTAVYKEFPDILSVAEESTSWPMVSRPVSAGGLGFGYKWNMGWMNDTLRYMRREPVHRRYHHEDLTFGLLYSFSENFILPLSHDEVVHGKGSLLGKMPGDRWQRFANLRLCLAYMFAYPGKKLLFMGCEFAQPAEWWHDGQLEWSRLSESEHMGVSALTRDLNALYRGLAVLHERDCEPGGFSWIDCEDAAQNTISFLRYGNGGAAHAVVVCNFSPVVRRQYRIGVPEAGRYQEVLNTDAHEYGGSGVGNFGAAESDPVPWHGYSNSLSLLIPPLGALVFLSPGTAAPDFRHV